jgi:hypothetical protein
VFSITWKETTTAVAADPTTYEETLRSGASKTFAGVPVDVGKVSSA